MKATLRDLRKPIPWQWTYSPFRVLQAEGNCGFGSIHPQERERERESNATLWFPMLEFLFEMRRRNFLSECECNEVNFNRHNNYG